MCSGFSLHFAPYPHKLILLMYPSSTATQYAYGIVIIYILHSYSSLPVEICSQKKKGKKKSIIK
nr:MAG TPA: hypothetical protein [Caudoviricetes sp.]